MNTLVADQQYFRKRSDIFPSVCPDNLPSTLLFQARVSSTSPAQLDWSDGITEDTVRKAAKSLLGDAYVSPRTVQPASREEHGEPPLFDIITQVGIFPI